MDNIGLGAAIQIEILSQFEVFRGSIYFVYRVMFIYSLHIFTIHMRDTVQLLVN